MKIQSERFFDKHKLKWEDLGGGVSRQILGYDKQIMMVKVKFEKEAIGAAHQHFHSQTTYVDSGKFEFTVDGEKIIVMAGDALYIEPNLVHGALCIEPGILIDVFAPVREDFLDGSANMYLHDKK